MERYIFTGVVAITLLALGVAFFLPSSAPQGPLYLPWQIEKTASGSTRVFGLELGSSTLGEARQRFQESFEVSMFANDDGKKVVEVYFDTIALSGLRARVVLVMALTAEQLNGFYERGVRIATMGSGNRKVTLADSDLQALLALPIASLTYIPRSNLDADVVLARFGHPAERIRETDSKEGIEHWLYPLQGLDIAVHEKGREVLQYVQPARFELLRKPLLEKGALISG